MARTDDRLFAPFPIEMDEHPKIIAISDAAFRAIFEATFYSRRLLTDGFLDRRVVLKRWGQEVADELSCNDPDRPSWVPVENGWRIHGFEKYHPLKADIDAIREKRALSGRRGGVRSGESRSNEANVKQTASKTEAQPEQTASETKPETETETETKATTSNEVERTAKRGSRLSPEWLPSTESIAKAKTDAPNVDHRNEHATFIDYWISQPGQKGVKTNWDATWRNWMRRKETDMKGRNNKPTPSQRAQTTLSLATEIDMREIGA